MRGSCRGAISLIFLLCSILSASSAVGIIDLDVDEQASTIFEFYYYNGSELVPTDYTGFQNKKYPLCTGDNPTYLITDTLSLMSQQEAGLSFAFSGQGLQTMRLELLDLNDNVLWSFCDNKLYSGTFATSGKVPYKTVHASDITVATAEPLPDLCRLRLSADAGKDSYKLHLQALNVYSDPLPWNECQLKLASPEVFGDSNMYLSWITLNGASSYNVIMEYGEAEPTVISVPAVNHATHHALLPLTGTATVKYRIEAVMGSNIVKSPEWSHTVSGGISNIAEELSAVTRIPGGITAVSAADGLVEVYSIAGIRVAVHSVQHGTPVEISLPEGLYIVRFPDTAVKVVVTH